MTARTAPPYRADHVGSLLRLLELHAARRRFAAGDLSATALREAEDAAIASAVAMQEEVGLALATDGELRRQSWHMDFIYQLGGVSRGTRRPDRRVRSPRRRDRDLGAGRAAGRRPDRARADDLRRGLRDARGTDADRDGEADDPVGQHDLLARRPRRDLRGGLSRPRRVLERRRRGLRRGAAAARRARLSLPPVRRHQPRDVRRSRDAGADRRARRRPRAATWFIEGPQRRDRAAAGGDGDRATPAAATTARPTRPAAATRRSRSRCSRASRSTASSSNTTTSARAGSSRCGSCRPAGWSCSGSSRPRPASSRRRTRSSGGSKRRAGTSRSSSCASRRSAGSPRRSRATTSATSSRSPSCGSWSRSRRMSGVSRAAAQRSSPYSSPSSSLSSASSSSLMSGAASSSRARSASASST